MRAILAGLVLFLGSACWSLPAWAQCTACCFMPCGDGVLDADEDCDDGNLVDGDGCPSDCRQISRVTTTNFATTVCGGNRSQDYFGALVVLPDGRPFVAAQAETGTGCFNPRVGLARYTRLGAPDPTFGGGTGRLVPGTTVEPRFPAAAVYQPSPRDRVVVGGTSYGSGDQSIFRLSAFRPDGTLDRDGFGFGNGTTAASFSGPLGTRDADLNALAPVSSSYLLGVGRASAGGGAASDDFALAMFHADGFLEFQETIDFAGGSDSPTAIAATTAPSRIVVVGTTSTPSVYSAIAMVGRKLNGFALEPDFSFASGAPRVLEGIGAPCFPTVADAAVRPEGQIVIAGSLWCPPTTYRLLLVQVLPDGTLDPTFGTGGIVIDDFSGQRGGYVQSAALLSDGRILVAATATAAAEPRGVFVLGRYLRNGPRDPTFGGLKEIGVPGSLLGLGADMRLAHEFDPRVGGAVFLGGTLTPPTSSDVDVVVHRQRLVETCGDGVLQPETEACDGGSFNGSGGRACCSSTCTVIPDGAICDNGIDEGYYDFCRDGVCVGPTTSTTTTTLPCAGCTPPDLAVTRIQGGGTVQRSASRPAVTRRIKVQFQNRSGQSILVPDHATLAAMLRLSVASTGSCPAPAVTLVQGKPQKPLPRVLRRKAKLDVVFEVVLDCTNDAAIGIGHEDFRLNALVDHSPLGAPDAHPSDDWCPRTVTPPSVIDPFPDGSIRDRGCGAKRADRTYGDPILIDVLGP